MLYVKLFPSNNCFILLKQFYFLLYLSGQFWSKCYFRIIRDSFISSATFSSIDSMCIFQWGSNNIVCNLIIFTKHRPIKKFSRTTVILFLKINHHCLNESSKKLLNGYNNWALIKSKLIIVPGRTINHKNSVVKVSYQQFFSKLITTVRMNFQKLY